LGLTHVRVSPVVLQDSGETLASKGVIINEKMPMG